MKETDDRIDLSNGIKFRDSEPEPEIDVKMPGSEPAEGKSPLIQEISSTEAK